MQLLIDLAAMMFGFGVSAMQSMVEAIIWLIILGTAALILARPFLRAGRPVRHHERRPQARRVRDRSEHRAPRPRTE
jgi:hypothetical protein